MTKSAKVTKFGEAVSDRRRKDPNRAYEEDEEDDKIRVRNREKEKREIYQKAV